MVKDIYSNITQESSSASITEHSKLRGIGLRYGLTAISATVSETATFPFDLAKTRLQLQGETANYGISVVKKKGMVLTAVDVARNEGFFKLWQGIQAALCRQWIYAGAKVVVYEELRELSSKRYKDGTLPIWFSAMNGLMAGAIGQLIASPMDLIKVQMQMEGKRRLEGKPVRIKSVGHAFRTIIRRGGMRGLWAGCVPNVQRAALVNIGDLAVYDRAKRGIIKHTNIGDTWICHSLSSVASGFASASLGTPADVVKTRVMNQPRDEHGKGLYYKSSIECIIKTVKNEGFVSLYKGFIPIWMRMAPWSIVFWLTFENVRRVSGINSF